MIMPQKPSCPHCGAKLKNKSVKIFPKCKNVVILPVFTIKSVAK